MSEMAVWAIGADVEAAAALADARAAVSVAMANPAKHPARPLILEDALREILLDAISLGGRHWEAPVRMAAEALARAGDRDSVALVMRWADIA